MLDALRSKASSWVVKAFLALLVVSFAIWGIGDILRAPRTGVPVATVGHREITPQQLARAFEQELRRLSQQLGQPVDRTHPLAAAALQRALERLIALELLAAWAEDLGVGVSDDELRRAIREDPTFQSGGRYDPERLRLVLRSLGMSEEVFVAEVRADLVRRRLVTALTLPVRAPKTLARTLWDFRNEARRGEVLLVEAAAMQVQDPPEEELRAYWEKNRDRFIRPEYRTVTIAGFGVEDIADEIAVSEDELRQLYEARREQLRRPERRRLIQLLATDPEVAAEVRRRLSVGESPEEVAEELRDQGVHLMDLGDVIRAQLPEELAEVAFAGREKEVAGPVRTPLGYHVIVVVSVTPEHVPDFAEARAELEKELRGQKAAEQLPRLATDLDDELAAGTSLEKAAEKFGIRVVTVVIDRSGRTPDGGRPDAPLGDEILQKIFAAREGEPPIVESTRDGLYFALRVDRIEPQRTMTFEEAKARVLMVWKLERQREAAKALAKTLIERAKQGTGFAELAQEFPGVRVVEVDGMKRQDDPARFGIDAPIAQALFRIEPGAVSEEPVETARGAAVVRVLERRPAPEPESLAGLEREIRDAWQDDLLVQLDAWLRTRYPVVVDDRMLAQFLQSGAS